MREIEFIQRILNSRLRIPGDVLEMVEEAVDDLCEQRILISTNRSSVISKVELYSFNGQFGRPNILLSFFNQNNDGQDKSPKLLNSFCDYVILLETCDFIPLIYFVEMKRGAPEHAKEQLAASRCFFDYVLRTAERIKDVNGYQDFDSKIIQFRMINIRETLSNKLTTRREDIQRDKFDEMLIHRHYRTSSFDPALYV